MQDTNRDLKGDTPLSFKLKQVSPNDIKVIRFDKEQKPSLGDDWFKNHQANIGIIAKKNSGKTNVIGNILKHMAGKNTKFMIFAATVNKDPCWIKIIEQLNKKHGEENVIAETSYIVDPEFDDYNEETSYIGDNNLISKFIKENSKKKVQEPKTLKKLETQKELKNPVQQIQSLNPYRSLSLAQQSQSLNSQPQQPPLQEIQEPEEPKQRKSKYKYPDFIIVFDDLAGEIEKSKEITKLLKTNRHYNLLTILSSQSLNDLNPRQVNQLDYMLMFANIPHEKVREAHEKLVLPIEFNKFYKLYEDATKEKYSFLYMDRDNHYRKNFNYLYQL